MIRGCNGVVRIAVVGVATAFLMGASTPAHPPVPEAKPSVPQENATPPVPPPDKGETPPVPEKRPPAPEPSEKPEKDSGKDATPPDETVVKPAPKPGDKTDAESPEGEKKDTDADEKETPAPTNENAIETGKNKNEEEPEIIPTPGVHENRAELETCYRDLDALGVEYAKEKMVNDPGVCGMESPIAVTKILPDVTLKPANLMRCATARAFARWTKTFVKPAAETLGKDVHLTGLSQGSAYICRLRNNADHGKVSEHAFGSAVDVVTFEFSGHDPISIEPRERTGKFEEGFQRAVVGSACLFFTTVLGPHADEAHQDNLHLDVMERNGGFRLCE